MKTVYSIENELQLKPEKVAAAQKLTLDKKSPQGLNGSHGLYGSDEWLDNLHKGVIPQRTVKGQILEAYKVGMYESNDANTLEITTESGTIENIGIYVNNPQDVNLFVEGKEIEVTYFIEELKAKDVVSGEHKKYEFVFEMKIEE